MKKKGNIIYLFGDPDEKTNDSEVKIVEETQAEDKENEFEPVYFETIEQEEEDLNEVATLLKLGSDKESGVLQATWDEVASIMNQLFRKGQKQDTESTWRKKYVKWRDEMKERQAEALENGDNTIDFTAMKEIITDIEKKRMQQRDERVAYTRQIRSESRQDMILQMFRDTIQKYPQTDIPKAPKEKTEHKAVYAMLSDIHFGLEFNTYVGVYNSEIAKERVLRYADEIILSGKREKAETCFVSLIGDMISGIIHPTIRVENKENAIEQVIGVSELVAAFLYYLSRHFQHVYVNSVDGNHSRLDVNLENTLRKERLDALIPWYCKAKLADQKNVEFMEAEFDATVGTFYIGTKLFVAVHGDLEKDLKTSAVVLEKRLGRHIDYLLAGHMHVPEMRAEDTMYIRNGSVCGSGDDYTMKKRLFSPPYQVFMILNELGAVESIHAVDLSDVKEFLEQKAV